MKEKDHRLDDYFERYGDMLFRHVRTFVDYHTAEDICQETFLRLAAHLDQVEPELVKALLLKVSKRLAYDYNKKGGRHKTKVGLGPEEMEIADVHSDTERIVIELEESREMDRVLGRLEKENPRWHDALLMRYQERMSDREIGSIMGIKASLVGQWRRRARLWLKDRYSSEEEEDQSR